MSEERHPLYPAVERIIKAARELTRTADEFWPEYPETIGEPLEALFGAIDQFTREAEALPTPPLDIPLYESV